MAEQLSPLASVFTELFGKDPQGVLGSLTKPLDIENLAPAAQQANKAVPRAAQPAPQSLPPNPVLQGIQKQVQANDATPRQGGVDVGQARQQFVSQKGAEGTEAADKKSAGIRNLLVNLGIPLATAGIGAAFPGARAGAAGFQQGFATEQARKRDVASESNLRNLFTIDEKGNVQLSRQIGKNDLVKSIPKEGLSADSLKAIFNDIPESKTTSEVAKGVSSEGEGDRQAAIKHLEDNGQPITEENIKFLLKQ